MGVFKRIELVYNSITKYIIIKTNLGIVYSPKNTSQTLTFICFITDIYIISYSSIIIIVYILTL